MKLIINSASTYKGGSEQVALSFIHECKAYPEHEFHVIIGEHLADRIDQSAFPENFYFHVVKKRPASGVLQFIKTMRWLNKLERTIKPDCVIATGGHGYWRPKAPLVTGFNMAHYLYPESPYLTKLPFKRRAYWKLRKWFDLFFFSRVDAFLTQTSDVNKRVRRLMRNKNVITVSNTVNGHFYEPISYPNKLPERGNKEIRLVTLSSYYPHKNLEIINKVAALLTEKGITNVKFILTLPQNIFDSIFNNGIRKQVYNIGPIPIEECPSLYQEIDFMFLPTLLECFSASYAEAMIMEKPILTSNLGFAHTVCKDAAVYFDPLDPEDIVTKIQQLINNPKQQEELIQKGREEIKKLNTAAERASKYLSICKKISANG
jgi:glycosyltransferase involved in cell wall biosynthesis